MAGDILIGLDSGTSMVKAVAFDFSGKQLAIASKRNAYVQRADGSATQPLPRSWSDCAATLRELAEQVPDLARRTAAISVTGQGDGTWLVGRNNEPVGEGWLWLDSRSAPTVQRMRARETDALRFAATGTGLNSCQQGMQLAHMQTHAPEMLKQSEAAMHCKDWLYLNLTGVRATDPSEACFTFGNYKTRQYDEAVIDSLGLAGQRHLLPPIIDGTQEQHPLTDEAARQTGLLAGTPVCLGYVDVVCTALGAGVYSRSGSTGCSIVGSTGMHMRCVSDTDVQLNDQHTGYVMLMPISGKVGQMQSNMAATLNIDWLLDMAAELVSDLGLPLSRSDLLKQVDRWASSAPAGALVYHPYISEAGERGPFVNNDARASFIGLDTSHRFPHMVRAVMEGLALAAADCYAAMGDMPGEVRVSGGAAKSAMLRSMVSAALGSPVRYSSRGEAGAAGAAMMGAVSLGLYSSMDDCVDAWVDPFLSELEAPDSQLQEVYQSLLPTYVTAREALAPTWHSLSRLKESES